jgi:general secretion pathway protein D
VIRNEVLEITSETVRREDVIQKIYYVGDLVIPIPNFVPSYNMGLPGAIRAAHSSMPYGQGFGSSGTVPLTVMAQNEQQPAALSPTALAQIVPNDLKIPSMAYGRNQQPLGFGPGGAGGGVAPDFDSLVELLTSTVAPESWDEVGGPGNVSPHAGNLSLVISQTQEIHEQIADLLEQLRRLQDLQVTIEVRFITINDNFFERVGIDFDFDIDDNSSIQAAGLPLPDDTGPSTVVGLDPTGNITTDGDLSFTQNSFGSAIPQFGGFDPATAANFGFAILSDIEVFFLLEAAQGDSRTNVLQAPKVTLFNGQNAFVSDTTQRPFVTSVIPVVGDFAAAHAPVVVVLSEGTSLSVQAVVSNDRRFVRLTLVPFFSQIGNVEEFTFNGKTSKIRGDQDNDPTTDDEDIITVEEGTTVQLPTFAFTTVTTTVSVPDGGTVLLGGIKRLQEGRNERGLPLLSKVPYVSRLFKNVGIGRTTQSLMMMVTPRIIIQEEEETKLGITIPQTP